jgi:ATP-binding cassette, subfamily B, bacterial CvaB/MchF/RaxB
MKIDKLDLGIFAQAGIQHVRQTELTECGLACLTMIAGYHGLNVDMGVMRRRFVPSTLGASLLSLMAISDRLGMSSRAVKVDLDDLGAISLPAILHWDMNHYVVLERVTARKALIHDPAGTSGWVRLADLSKSFTGVALEIEPTNEFEKGEVRQTLRLTKLWTNIRGLKRAVSQVVLLSLIMQAFALAFPYYFQLALDRALPELNLGFLGILALGFALFVVLNGVASLIRSSVLLAVGSAFGYGLSSNIARKLFRLPVEWYSRRHIGDILSRFQSVVPIRKMLAEDAPAALVDGALAGLTFILMLFYSASLTLLALAALTIYMLIKVLLFRAHRAAEEETIVATGREQSALIETVRGIRPLRLAGREAMRHALWQSRLTDAVNGSVRSQRLTNWQTTLQTTLFALENVVSVWLAVGMVIKGGFSVGMVFAFLAYKTQFLNAAASLITKAFDFKMLSLHLDRLSDIALETEDMSFASDRHSAPTLKGKIALQEVFYRYGDDDPLVLKGVNFTIEAGESVAITGPSGGGKSTLVQILLGLTKPTSGNVIVDGLLLQQFGYRSFHAQVAAVLQDDTLFGGSLSENISLFDEIPNAEFIRECARIAAIDDDIEALPMGYETLVGEMGAALSGGQRQRVLLARALYLKPRLLVMDEGTSSLDEVRERQINNAISAMGITRIIVAHRKETIASAQRVLYLDDGVVLERQP